MLSSSSARARSRITGVALLVSMTVCSPLVAPPVAARALDAAQTATSDTTTAPPPTTQAPVPTTAVPTTPVPTTGGGSTTTDGGSTTTVGSGPGSPLTNPDGTPMVTEPGDRGAGEEPPDEAPPAVDLTVPPRADGRYANQGAPGTERVLVSNLTDARKKVAAAERAHSEAIALVKVLRLREKALDLERVALDDQTRQTLVELEVARTRLRERALKAFVAGGGDELVAALGSSLDAGAALELQAQKTMVETVFETDEEVIAEYERTRRALDAQTLGLFERMALVSESMGLATADVELKAATVEQARRELEAFEAGSQIYVHGVVFPIQWPYDVPLIDSWGFPRMTGTADQHWHEGIDIFAPSGTPLLAAERGVVTRIGSGRLGGLRLWLRGASGTDWYYAHLSGFARGLAEGQVVEAGDVLGYVGNTGNAVGTPPHLHMQVHPNGGAPVNPYPLLKVVSDRERGRAGAGRRPPDREMTWGDATERLAQRRARAL